MNNEEKNVYPRSLQPDLKPVISAPVVEEAPKKVEKKELCSHNYVPYELVSFEEPDRFTKKYITESAVCIDCGYFKKILNSKKQAFFVQGSESVIGSSGSGGSGGSVGHSYGGYPYGVRIANPGNSGQLSRLSSNRTNFSSHRYTTTIW